MAGRQRDRHGRPVPWVAAWSSETWAIGHDPLVGRLAILTRGRPGHGQPILGVLNEPRQRRAVLQHLCQVCGQPLGDDAWIPDVVATATTDDGRKVTTEPPSCLPCALWAVAACPGLRHTTSLLLIRRGTAILQLVDPSRAPAAKAGRFGGDDEAHRRRLGVIARRHGGAVGYVKIALDAVEEHPLTGWSPLRGFEVAR